MLELSFSATGPLPDIRQTLIESYAMSAPVAGQRLMRENGSRQDAQVDGTPTLRGCQLSVIADVVRRWYPIAMGHEPKITSSRDLLRTKAGRPNIRNIAWDRCKLKLFVMQPGKHPKLHAVRTTNDPMISGRARMPSASSSRSPNAHVWCRHHCRRGLGSPAS